MKILFFFLSVVMYNLWVLLNLDAMIGNPGSKRPSITTDRQKFYYQLELFCPGILDECEKYTKLHREWVEKGVTLARVTVF